MQTRGGIGRRDAVGHSLASTMAVGLSAARAWRSSDCPPHTPWHLYRWIERIPGKPRENDGLETGLWGAAARIAWDVHVRAHTIGYGMGCMVVCAEGLVRNSEFGFGCF